MSIVVVTRDGAPHLKRLFDGLENRTAYRSFDVIVVDNGSSDETPDVLNGDWSFQLATIRYDRNTSFAFANNAGLATASGELILFLNNDVDPISPHWLGAMIKELVESDHVAGVGALLVYPERVKPEEGNLLHPDLTIQHAGVSFTFRRGAVRAANLDAGSDPLAPDLTRTAQVPALTAACLMARTADVRDIGGFDPGYVYGSEDWDLSLSLRERGVLVRSGAAALFHHEYGTQDLTPRPEKTVNRRLNQIHFDKRWGPFLFRRLLSDRIKGGARYADGTQPRLWFQFDDKTSELDKRAIGVIADELRTRGWTVSTDETQPDDIDVVVALTPMVDLDRRGSHPVSMAWVIDRLDMWIRDGRAGQFDIVAAADPLAADLLSIRFGQPVVYLPPGPTSALQTEPSPSYEADVGMWATDEPQAKAGLRLLDEYPADQVALFGAGWTDMTEVMDRCKGDPLPEDIPIVTASIPHWVVPPDRQRVGPSPLVMDILNSGATPFMNHWDDAVGLFGNSHLYVRNHVDLRERRRQLESGEGKGVPIDRVAHTAGRRADTLIDALEEHAGVLRIGIRICAPNRQVAPRWGDLHFAEQFAGALRRKGAATGVHVASEWTAPENQTYQVVVHMRGVKPLPPAPGAFNVLWIVSHPEDVTEEECRRFDLVLAASSKHAGELATSIDVPVYPFLQATDTRLFAPSRERHPRYSHEVVFVGNARWPVRSAPRWMLEHRVRFALYGANWDGFPEERLRVGDFVPNEDLPALYRSAEIVVNDHWPDMARLGYVSNRIFDVLAAGGFVISDQVEGMADVFDGAVPTFDSADELVATLETYSADPNARLLRTLTGMDLVRRHHSFDERAARLMDLLATHSDVVS